MHNNVRFSVLPIFIISSLCLIPSIGHAFNWIDLWKTKDQQAQEILKQGDNSAAAEMFNNPAWKATAQYQNGNYEQAATNFATSSTGSALYNQANALALSGQLQQSIDRYDAFLADNPNHEDALHNKAVVEKLLEEQEQEKEQEQEQDQQKQEDGEQSDEQQRDSENSSEEQDSQQEKNGEAQNQQKNDEQASESSSDSEQDQEESEQESKQNDKKEQEKQDQQKKNASEQQAQDDNATEQDKEQQALEAKELEDTPDDLKPTSEQWLRALNDDPSGLLRKKFQEQYKQNLRERSRNVPVSSREQRY